jgi:hypothetical protein
MSKDIKLDQQAALPMPGSNLAGRGIALMPHQPYQLRGVLFARDKFRSYYSVETKQTYLLPEGYEVNENPPMPADRALNQVMIEESFERFEKSTSLDANVAVGTGVFSISANLSSSNQVRSDEEAYYALRSSFIPLWTIFLPSIAGAPGKELEADIPGPYSPDKRRAFDTFFAKHGTHYIKRVWVGGKADLSFTIAKSANMSKADIQAGLTASYGAAGSGRASSQAQEKKEQLQANSECVVSGKGGNELLLAALSSLDEAKYNEWVNSITENPQVIELEVEGLWNLIEDEDKAKALQAAYAAATTFTPISSMLRMRHDLKDSLGSNLKDNILFIRRAQYSAYHIGKGKSRPPQRVNDLWPALAEAGIMEIDAVLECSGLLDEEGSDISGSAYFFDEGGCVLMDLQTGVIAPGYPKTISEALPGVSFPRIDAALNAGPDFVYLFMGNQYLRYNHAARQAEEGYPQLISRRWAGVTFDRIDAATYWGNGKVYFFRGDQHIRYDLTMFRADPGYPKSIIGSYVEDMKFFE